MSYKKPNDESKPEKTSFAKYDFVTICAGVMFLIRKPDHIVTLDRFLVPDWFFQGDESLQVRALRQVLKIVIEIKNDKGVGLVSEKMVHTYLSQQGSDEVYDAAKRLYGVMQTDPLYLGKVDDAGCQSVFLDFLKANATMQWSSRFASAWAKGDMTNATKRMKELTTDIDSIRFDAVEDQVDFGKLSVDELLGMLSVNVEGTGELFLLGHKKMDDDVGGFERRALHLFCGATNSGKSMMSQYLIKRSIEQRLCVHIAVVEDRPKSFLRRLVASISGIPINRLKYHHDTSFSEAERQAIDLAKRQIDKYVKIDYAYSDSLDTIHRRKRDYDAERIAKGMKPYDVDIVDYTGHIAEKAAGEKTYEKYRNAYAARKNFALAHDKIAFDFAQLNRTGFQKRSNNVHASHGDLAGSYDLSQVCDNIIVLSREEGDAQNNDTTLMVSKVKDGALISTGYKVGTNFACARWDMNKYSGDAVVSVEDSPLAAQAAEQQI